MGVLGEDQDCFRIDRSTADSSQICVRLQEEVFLYVNESTNVEDWTLVPTLLDVKKAYSIFWVNRPTLWSVLWKYGMKEEALEYRKGCARRQNAEQMAKGEEVILAITELAAGKVCHITYTFYCSPFSSYEASSRKREQEAKERGIKVGIGMSWLAPREFITTRINWTGNEEQRERNSCTHRGFVRR